MSLDGLLGETFRRLTATIIQTLEEGKSAAYVRGNFGGKSLRISYNFSVGLGLEEVLGRRETIQRPPYSPRLAPERPEPFIDVIERGDTLTILALLPGVKKEDTKIRVTKNSISVGITKDGREIQSWNVPWEARPKVVSITFKNGVLEVVLRKGKGGRRNVVSAAK